MKRAGTLDRYVFRLVTVRVLYTFAVIILLFFVVEIVERNHHYSRYIRTSPQSTLKDLGDIATYAFFRLLPGLLQFGAMATLIGCIFTAAHLNANNEFTAMRAAGVRLARAMAPALVVGLLISAVSLGLANEVMPDLVLKGQELEPAILLRQRRFGSNPLAVQLAENSESPRRDVVLYVGRYLPARQLAVEFQALVVEDDRHTYYFADAARWRGDGWHFVLPPEQAEAGTVLEQPLGRMYRYSEDIVGKPVSKLETRLSPGMLVSKRLGPAALQLSQMDTNKPELAVAYHRRLAGLISGLTVLGLGLPLIVGNPLGNPWTQRALALALAALYLSVTFLAASLAARPAAPGWAPPLAVWGPELIFFTVAAYMMLVRMDA